MTHDFDTAVPAGCQNLAKANQPRYCYHGHIVKSLIRQLLSPLFRRLESGEGGYHYKRSHRVILLIMSGLFLFLASLSLVIAPSIDYLFPVLIFGMTGLLGIVVGWAGTDEAVARIWGSK